MTNTLVVGSIAPQFSWLNKNSETVTLKDMLGKHVVLYFYPKDNTPGCTIEANGFTSKFQDFTSKDAIIVGVSRDTESSHQFFSNLCGIPFPLIADVDSKVCNAYGTLKEKSMFGKKYIGIERSTFLINPEGAIAHIWQKVSVKNHAQEVLNAIP